MRACVRVCSFSSKNYNFHIIIKKPIILARVTANTVQTVRPSCSNIWMHNLDSVAVSMENADVATLDLRDGRRYKPTTSVLHAEHSQTRCVRRVAGVRMRRQEYYTMVT